MDLLLPMSIVFAAAVLAASLKASARIKAGAPETKSFEVRAGVGVVTFFVHGHEVTLDVIVAERLVTEAVERASRKVA